MNTSIFGLASYANSVGLPAIDWLALLRIGLGMWWLESVRHKDKVAWINRGAGIEWARSIADRHKWKIVSRTFSVAVVPRPKTITYVILGAELAIGIGISIGLLTPIALVAGLLLNGTYFVLMIHDWAEQGQNAMMALVSVTCLLVRSNQVWSVDHFAHILGG